MSGYIGTQPVPQATQNRESFTATASQTSFATIGYTPQFLDVYLNGVHLLNGTDYTATNGSDVVLTTGAAAGDVLEVVSYSTYEVNSQNYTGGLTVDNDGATVLTVDRATSDGTIIDLQKNGTSVGSIMSYAGDMVTGTGDVGLRWEDAGDLLTPWNPSTNLPRASAIDLGASSVPFKDLYLSGGVYLGGTGSANKLEDYEEGTWTPTIFGTSSGSLTLTPAATGKYVKIGRFVQASVFQLEWTANSGLTGLVALGGLPFASDYNRYCGGAFGGSSSGSMSFTGRLDAGLDPSTSTAYVMYRDNANNTYSHYPTFSATGVIYGFTISYQTDA
jgi:hypothetical protein